MNGVKYADQLTVRGLVPERPTHLLRWFQTPSFSSFPSFQPSDPHARAPLRAKIEHPKNVVHPVVRLRGAVNCRSRELAIYHDQSSR